MQNNTRRRYLNRLATTVAAVTGAPMLLAQQPYTKRNLLLLRHWF
jgi:hypothetical protein